VEPKAIVGANIRACREELGWTQEDLAYEADMHINEVGRAERGKRDMRVSTLARFAHALEVPAGKLTKGI
jgi:transcriptional regulator with XRE-family HTH domain